MKSKDGLIERLEKDIKEYKEELRRKIDLDTATAFFNNTLESSIQNIHKQYNNQSQKSDNNQGNITVNVNTDQNK